MYCGGWMAYCGGACEYVAGHISISSSRAAAHMEGGVKGRPIAHKSLARPSTDKQVSSCGFGFGRASGVGGQERTDIAVWQGQ